MYTYLTHLLIHFAGSSVHFIFALVYFALGERPGGIPPPSLQRERETHAYCSILRPDPATRLNVCVCVCVAARVRVLRVCCVRELCVCVGESVRVCECMSIHLDEQTVRERRVEDDAAIHRYAHFVLRKALDILFHVPPKAHQHRTMLEEPPRKVPHAQRRQRLVMLEVVVNVEPGSVCCMPSFAVRPLTFQPAVNPMSVCVCLYIYTHVYMYALSIHTYKLHTCVNPSVLAMHAQAH